MTFLIFTQFKEQDTKSVSYVIYGYIFQSFLHLPSAGGSRASLAKTVSHIHVWATYAEFIFMAICYGIR